MCGNSSWFPLHRETPTGFIECNWHVYGQLPGQAAPDRNFGKSLPESSTKRGIPSETVSLSCTSACICICILKSCWCPYLCWTVSIHLHISMHLNPQMICEKKKKKGLLHVTVFLQNFGMWIHTHLICTREIWQYTTKDTWLYTPCLLLHVLAVVSIVQKTEKTWTVDSSWCGNAALSSSHVDAIRSGNICTTFCSTFTYRPEVKPTSDCLCSRILRTNRSIHWGCGCWCGDRYRCAWTET